MEVEIQRVLAGDGMSDADKLAQVQKRVLVRPLEAAEAHALFDSAVKWVMSSVPLHRNVGSLSLKKIATEYPKMYLEMVFPEAIIELAMTNEDLNCVVFGVMNIIQPIKYDCHVLNWNCVLAWLLDHALQLPVQSRPLYCLCVACLVSVNSNIEDIKRLNILLVDWLADSGTDAPVMRSAFQQLLQKIWKLNDSHIVDALSQAFHHLCKDDAVPSPTLRIVLEQCPTRFVESSIQLITSSQTSIHQNVLSRIVLRLCHWPVSQDICGWIIALLQGLDAAGFHLSLSQVLPAASLQIFAQIDGIHGATAFNVLERMLLGHIHNPSLFHFLIPQFSVLLHKCGAHGGGSASVNSTAHLPAELEFRLCRLLYALMYAHTGFPELYEPLRQNIPSYLVFSQQELVDLLQENTWKNVSVGSSLCNFAESRFGVGLVNLGNTCYMNAFIQSLYYSSPFREKLMVWRPVAAQQQTPSVMLLRQLQRTFAYLTKSERSSFCPDQLRRCLPVEYQSGAQQDAFEFGRCLLDLVETAWTAAGGEDPVSCFRGKYAHRITCQNCRQTREMQESFIDLGLAMPEKTAARDQKLTLEQLIQAHFTPEVLDGENCYHCEHCNGRFPALRKHVITHSPDHLIVTLHRFSYDASTSQKSKIMNEVEFPKELTIPKETQGRATQWCSSIEEAQKQSAAEAEAMSNDVVMQKYRLYGLIIHSGYNTQHGHYYAQCRPSVVAANANNDEGDNDKWMRLNDEYVTETSLFDAQRITAKFPSDVAYVLFYVQQASSSMTKHEFDTKVDLYTDVALKGEVVRDNNQFRQERQQHGSNSHSNYRYWKDDSYDHDNSSNSFTDLGSDSLGHGGGGSMGSGGFGGWVC